MELKTSLIAASIVACLALPAQAATIEFDTIIQNGALAGNTGSGSVTFDETLLTGVGDESIGLNTVESDFADPGFTLSLLFEGVLFTQSNDIDFPDFPNLEFEDGVLTEIDYFLEDGVQGADLLQFGIDEIDFEDLFISSLTGRLTVEIDVVDVSAVPLPAGMPLLLSALGAGAFIARRRKKAAAK